jgi:hypothetical protein
MSRGALLLTGVVVAAAIQARALNPLAQQWVQRFHSPGSGNNYPTRIAADNRGNVFVAGYDLTSNGYPDYDFVTLKYSSSGAPLWTNYYDGPAHGFDHAVSLALDRTGNAYVTGISDGGATGYDYATIAYSNNGVPLWTNRYAGPTNSDDEAEAIAVDSKGAVYVTGFSTNSSFQYVTIKYSHAGVPLWTNALTAAPGPLPSARAFLAIAKNGTVFVSGEAVGQTSAADYVTVAYSSAGAPLWTNDYNGPGNLEDYPTGNAVDTRNHVIVTGGSRGAGTNWDFATIAYSATGVPLWTNRFDGPAHGDDIPTAIAVNGSTIYVTGDTTLTTNANDFSSYATIAYSTAGKPLWTNIYAPMTNDDEPAAIASESRGVVVTGSSFDPATLADYATVEYSSAGVPLTTNRYNGPLGNNDYADAIAVAPNGDVLVTGYSTGTNSGFDITTVKYSRNRPAH